MRTEDGKIIDRCLNGEPEAFGLLVDKYKVIFALIYSKPVFNTHENPIRVLCVPSRLQDQANPIFQ